MSAICGEITDMQVLSTLRWYLTIKAYEFLEACGLHSAAEAWSRRSGLHSALRRYLWQSGADLG